MNLENILKLGRKKLRNSFLAGALLVSPYLSGCAFLAEDYDDSNFSNSSVWLDSDGVERGGVTYFIPQGSPIPGMPGFIAKKSIYVTNGVITNERGEGEDPENKETARLHYVKGVEYVQRGLFERAIKQFEKAASRDREFAYKAYVELGKACLEREWYDHAEKQFEMALEENSNESTPHRYLAIIKESKGMHDEAISELEKIIEKIPNDLDAHLGIASLYERQNLDDKALEKYQKITKIKPNEALAHYALGNIYKKKLIHDKAEEEWKKAIEIKPDFADAHNNLAVHYYEQGRYIEALREWQEVKELDSSYHNLDRNINLAEEKIGSIPRQQEETGNVIRSIHK